MVHVLAPLKEDAEARHAEAQFSLGEMYAEGLSVQQDETQARSWFEHAAQGHAEAQCRLGGMLAEGLGGSRDCTRIQHWLMKAAAQGNAGALFGLGMMHDEGLCVPQDRRATKARLGRACRSGARKACARARERAISVESVRGGMMGASTSFTAGACRMIPHDTTAKSIKRRIPDLFIPAKFAKSSHFAKNEPLVYSFISRKTSYTENPFPPKRLAMA